MQKARAVAAGSQVDVMPVEQVQKGATQAAGETSIQPGRGWRRPKQHSSLDEALGRVSRNLYDHYADAMRERQEVSPQP